jgi:hypothetical protein
MAGKLTRKVKPVTERARATDFAHTLRSAYEAGKRDDEGAPASAPASGPDDVAEVADALSGVDWAKVRAATADRTAEMSKAMKAMAADVDWARVQAGAARVSTALIAAVASGQLPVGGRLAGPVARAIINDRGLAQQVSERFPRGSDTEPPDFRGIIETTGRDAS